MNATQITTQTPAGQYRYSESMVFGDDDLTLLNATIHGTTDYSITAMDMLPKSWASYASSDLEIHPQELQSASGDDLTV